jgi:hypothetical protein
MKPRFKFLNAFVCDLCLRSAKTVTYFVFRKKRTKIYIHYDDLYVCI